MHVYYFVDVDMISLQSEYVYCLKITLVTNRYAKEVAPKEFGYFFKNYREVCHKIVHTSYPFTYLQIWKVSYLI